MIPAKIYRTVLKKGMTGHEVWALQINLNEYFRVQGISPVKGILVKDGIFGNLTFETVKQFQSINLLTIDGIAGVFQTQRTLARELWETFEVKQNLPLGLLYGLTEGESGFVVGAVNWLSSDGGVDCGYVQRHVVASQFKDSVFENAFNGGVQYDIVSQSLRYNKNRYATLGNSDQRSWELAILSHNSPWMAETLAKHKTLSDEPVHWVQVMNIPGVESAADWAEWYIQSKTAYITIYNK